MLAHGEKTITAIALQRESCGQQIVFKAFKFIVHRLQ
jgi:hypothetical protein